MIKDIRERAIKAGHRPDKVDYLIKVFGDKAADILEDLLKGSKARDELRVAYKELSAPKAAKAVAQPPQIQRHPFWGTERKEQRRRVLTVRHKQGSFWGGARLAQKQVGVQPYDALYALADALDEQNIAGIVRTISDHLRLKLGDEQALQLLEEVAQSLGMEVNVEVTVS